MLRLDSGEGRVHTTRSFQVWEGGGEYNVARGLKRCFGLDATLVTAFADNAVGRLVQDLIYQGGVDQSHAKWVKFDGVGRTVRNGLNFTERGFGPRGGVGCSDRGCTAISQMRPEDVDWQGLFGRDGVRALHRGLLRVRRLPHQGEPLGRQLFAEAIEFALRLRGRQRSAERRRQQSRNEVAEATGRFGLGQCRGQRRAQQVLAASAV